MIGEDALASSVAKRLDLARRILAN